MQLIMRSISVNFSIRAVVLQGELSFAAAGFHGVFIELDLRKLPHHKTLLFILIGSSYDCSLRHFEIIKATSEIEAIHKSEWYRYLCALVSCVYEPTTTVAGTCHGFSVPASFDKPTKRSKWAHPQHVILFLGPCRMTSMTVYTVHKQHFFLQT